MSAVGFATLPEPLRGAWALPTFPERVQLLGRVFKRSDTWALPTAGVLAQYREETDRNSMHLYVHADRTWSIDHVDEANPERGLVLEHTFRDVVQTWWGALLLTTALVGTSAGAAWFLTRR